MRARKEQFDLELPAFDPSARVALDAGIGLGAAASGVVCASQSISSDGLEA